MKLLAVAFFLYNPNKYISDRTQTFHLFAILYTPRKHLIPPVYFKSSAFDTLSMLRARATGVCTCFEHTHAPNMMSMSYIAQCTYVSQSCFQRSCMFHKKEGERERERERESKKEGEREREREHYCTCHHAP